MVSECSLHEHVGEGVPDVLIPANDARPRARRREHAILPRGFRLDQFRDGSRTMAAPGCRLGYVDVNVARLRARIASRGPDRQVVCL